MTTEHPSGPFPPVEPRRLEIRPIGGIQELREVLTEARLADVAPRESAGATAILPPGNLADLLAELGATAAPAPKSLWARAKRALGGRALREEQARSSRLLALLRGLALERQRFETSIHARLEQLADRLEEIERGQADLRGEARRLESELAERRTRPALGDSTPP